MSKYVDGYILVVPKGKSEEYRKMSEQGRDSWIKNGALQYFECRGEDLRQQEMGPDKSRSFKEMTGAKDGDEVWFSFIVFESRQHRDKVNQKVMKEMEETYKDDSGFVSPVDMRHMAYGGFEALVEGMKAWLAKVFHLILTQSVIVLLL